MSFNSRTLAVLAGACALSTLSAASIIDATVTISRAIDSPTLSIHYSGAHATLAEFLVNGQSVATRTLDGSNEQGDFSFTVSTASLHDGDNDVEVKLFNKNGNLVGMRRTVVTAGADTDSPFYISAPKVGAQVEGQVPIEVGFGQTFAGAYVSFFVDDNLMALTNTPPFRFVWDTTTSTNGWHQIESWLVDKSSTTYKTRKIRVFVNNPSGNTGREVFNRGTATKITVPKPTKVANAMSLGLTTLANADHKWTVGSQNTTLRPLTGAVKTDATGALSFAAIPTMSAIPLTALENSLHVAVVGNVVGLKPIATSAIHTVALGPIHLTPTGKRLATGTVSPELANMAPKAKPAPLMKVTRGTRLPIAGPYAIELDGQYVDFDVQPQVHEGIPVTPLRYLIEKKGGTVKWFNQTKVVTATADGKSLWLKIGDPNALLNTKNYLFESAPFISGSRTIVPLSFIHDLLDVNVDFDQATGHVLITSTTK